MAPVGNLVLLRHGTTRQRAEAIYQAGPDVNFKEPFGYDPAGGFSTARVQSSYPYGSPDEVALRKAALFPNEGGPAILELEVPDWIVQMADVVGEVRFDPGYGLEELLIAWPSLSKRIVVP